MTDPKREEYIVEGFVKYRGTPISGAQVIAEIVDLDLNEPFRHSGLIGTVWTILGGYFKITIPNDVLQPFRKGDKRARLVLQAIYQEVISNRSIVGTELVEISVASPPDPVTINLGLHDRAGDPLVVDFSTEVLDAILSLTGGATTAGSSTATGVFDDRFFEERLRRLIGANVRAGDIGGLRREIDRVVVEEEVEGEKQFVFRAAGRPRASQMSASAGYTRTAGAPSGSLYGGGATSPYTSASRTASAATASANGAGAATPSGADNLDGKKEIM